MALGMLGPLLVGALHDVPLRFDLNLILRTLLFIFLGGLPLGPPRLGKAGGGCSWQLAMVLGMFGPLLVGALHGVPPKWHTM